MWAVATGALQAGARRQAEAAGKESIIDAKVAQDPKPCETGSASANGDMEVARYREERQASYMIQD